jgi:hypothetical protein
MTTSSDPPGADERQINGLFGSGRFGVLRKADETP